MNIAIIGTGYVGSVTGACFAEMGHAVEFVGRDRRKLECIREGKSPIFEPGLDELLGKNRASIRTTTDLAAAVQKSDLTFICVGTPPKKDGSGDLGQVETVAGAIGNALRSLERYHTVVVKSTVPPGTTESCIIPVIEERSGRSAHRDFGIAANPEFLKEGSAVEDFFHADRVVIGADDAASREVMETLYRPLNVPLFTTTIRTAEMVKYASNAFLATKISFANEIGNLCKVMTIDSYEVFRGVGLDTRINPHFFRSGAGFGGSCLPKDVRALIAHARSRGVEPEILRSVLAVNDRQPERMIALLGRHLDIPGRTIGVLGLTFKPDTDDIRESRAIPVIRSLLDLGASVVAYDPCGMPAFRDLFPSVRYAGSAADVLESDAVLILTEWEEFECLDYHGALVIDGRRIEKARREAQIYEGMCW